MEYDIFIRYMFPFIKKKKEKNCNSVQNYRILLPNTYRHAKVVTKERMGDTGFYSNYEESHVVT